MVFRRRAFLYKLLLLVPVVWFGALLFFAANNGQNEAPGSYRGGLGRDSAREVDINPPQPVNRIEGFGPPLQNKIPESMGGEANREVGGNGGSHGLPDDAGNIPKPKKFVIDADSPIYKQGDPNQAGEGGKAVKVDKKDLSPEQKKIFDEGMQKNAFNDYVSNMISLRRSLPKAADQECIDEKYSERLPDTSVVICFHNEAWSVLLRTVHSVLERTADNLLKEIILVDDFSDMEHVKKPLDDYLTQYPKVKVVRLEKREGLIRARIRGFNVATGKTVTFLDSHCECMEGWLPPLLDRIARDPSTVVCPVIDVIDDTTFQYHYSKAYFTNVGGFDWSLQFNWHAIPERDRKNRKRAIDPVPSPTMAGGLFTIDSAYFKKLGTYDSGFDIWGGENLELSFKIWMCGGRLEIVPCSHVGHIFRKRSPYKWRSGVNVLKRNSIRLAEVWLDEYKKYYYERINNNLGDFGDVSDRKALRENLQCKSFRWYLDNVFPELFVPGDAIATGEVRNGGASNDPMCLDSPVGEEHHNKAVTPYPCHEQGGNQVRNKGGGSKQCLDWGPQKHGRRSRSGRLELYWCHNQGGNQYWMLSKDGEIRRDESCVDYAGQDVMIFPCHSMKGNQEWRYDHKKSQLLHKVTSKCLEMGKDGAKLLMKHCDPENDYQKWVFKNFDPEKAKSTGIVFHPQTGRCLEGTGAWKVTIGVCNSGSANQRWRFSAPISVAATIDRRDPIENLSIEVNTPFLVTTSELASPVKLASYQV